MTLRAILTTAVIVLCMNDSLACFCRAENFLKNAIRDKRDLFEARLVCRYYSPDLGKIIGSGVYLFQVTRYWSPYSVSSYVMIAADASTTCSIRFETEGELWIFSAPSPEAKYGDQGPVYFVNQCTAIEARYLQDQIATVTAPKRIDFYRDLPSDPCSTEFSRLDDELFKKDSLAGTYFQLSEQRSEQIASLRLIGQSLTIAFLMLPLFPFVFRIRKSPIGIWTKSFVVSIVSTLLFLVIALTAGVFRTAPKAEVFQVNDVIWMIFLVGIVYVVLTLPSLAALSERFRKNTYVRLLTFVFLPLIFLVYTIYNSGPHFRLSESLAIFLGAVYIVVTFLQIIPFTRRLLFASAA